MKLELVSHCLSGPGAQYAQLLRYQLDSIFRYGTSKVDVMLSVLYTPQDKPTREAIDEYAWPIGKALRLNPVALDKPLLLNRTIGRNLRARQSDADILWFTDCDYVFGEGCLDGLAQLGRKDDYGVLRVAPDAGGPLWFPRHTQVNVSHSMGDEYLHREPPVSSADFVPKLEHSAIGGIQIADGAFCRKHGYVDKPKYQQPAPEDCDTIIGFPCDRRFRIQCGGPGTPIELPNLFRLRHSVTGDGRAVAKGIPQPPQLQVTHEW